MTAADLIAFEAEAARRYDAGEIKSPLHLSGGNEDQLREIFVGIGSNDYVFSGHRSHYHALLKGIPRDLVMERILAGKSMNLEFPEHKFYTSAIVGGCLPIALGVAAGIKRKWSGDLDVKFAPHVWCFIGDMAMYTGICGEVTIYAQCYDLPITIVTEDNGLSTDTPTLTAWGYRSMSGMLANPRHHRQKYTYTRTRPHVGTTGKGSM